jgi:MFS transporter, FHS family, L-fucose permease
LAGLIFGYIALSDADVLEQSLATMDAATRDATLSELAGRVIVPYYIISGVLMFLAVAIMFSSLPDINDSGEDDLSTVTVTPSAGKTSVFQFPHLMLGVLALFVYVGVEVMAGDTIISYGKSLGIELATARYFSQATLAFMLLGYIIGIVSIPRYMTQATALKLCAISGAIFTMLAVVTSGWLSVAFIALLGLSNSLVWPAVWPLALEGLGRFTKIGSGLLVMAIAGGAILPLLYGALADVWNTKQAYWIMVPCYLYILYFATRGYKVGKTTAVSYQLQQK